MAGMSRPDVLIIGAGVAGLTTAESLRRAGFKVALIDAGPPAGESSWAGGGILCPVPPWNYPDVVNALVARSRELYPELIERIEAGTGIDCEYRRTGLLLMLDPGRRGLAWLDQHGDSHERGPVGRFEPQLAHPDQPALRLGGIPQVRNPRLGRALTLWLRSQGVDIFSHTPVARLKLAGDLVDGAELGCGRHLSAGAVVLAAGAWTDRLLLASGLQPLGIDPVRGQMLLFNPGRRLITNIINGGSGYLIPRADHRILAGSTVEAVGFERRPTRNAYHAILQSATAMLPALTEAALECQWTGFRPGVRDDRPHIGAYPGARCLWINSGGFRNGLGIAPAAAEALQRQLDGGAGFEACAPRIDRGNPTP